MKTRFIFVALLFGLISCTDDSEPQLNKDYLPGFWRLEEVTVTGTSATEINNSPANFLRLYDDKTFVRAYESGMWKLRGKQFTLDRNDASGMSDWSYQIISLTEDKLIVEMKLEENQYRWDFYSFAENEILTIREVYNKPK